MSLNRLLQIALVAQVFTMAAGLHSAVHTGPWGVVLSNNALDFLGWFVIVAVAVAVLIALKDRSTETLFGLSVGIFLFGMLFSDSTTVAQHDLWPWAAGLTAALALLPLIQQTIDGLRVLILTAVGLLASILGLATGTVSQLAGALHITSPNSTSPAPEV